MPIHDWSRVDDGAVPLEETYSLSFRGAPQFIKDESLTDA